MAIAPGQLAAAGVADDQAGGQHHVARLQGDGCVQPAEQKLSSVGADLVGRLHCHGQEGEEPRGVGQIVEADQGDVVGDAQAAALQLVDHAHGDGVVGGKDGIGGAARVQRLRHHALAGEGLVLAVPDQPRVLRDARLGQRDAIAQSRGRPPWLWWPGQPA